MKSASLQPEKDYRKISLLVRIRTEVHTQITKNWLRLANPGDGQQREEGGQDHLGQIELTPYEAGKPGFTGHRPLISAAGAGPSMTYCYFTAF